MRMYFHRLLKLLSASQIRSLVRKVIFSLWSASFLLMELPPPSPCEWTTVEYAGSGDFQFWLGCDKLGVCQQKWQTDEFIRQKLMNFWRTFDELFVRIRQKFFRICQILQKLQIRWNPRNFDQIWVEQRWNFEKNHKNREKLPKIVKFAEILILERCKGMHIL
jgi:hypothetical protein